MGLSDNLEALIKKYNITQNQFAASIGVSAPTVSRWMTSGTGIRNANVARICQVYGLVPDDILSDSLGLAGRVPGDDLTRPSVPLVSGSAAGKYVDGVRCGPLKRIEVTVSIVENHPHAFALPVEDDAMNLVIPASSHAIVDPDVEPENLSTVVVEVEELPGVMLRRMLKGKSTMVLTAESTHVYDDIVVTEDGRRVRVLGTVVWFQPSGPV